MGGSFSPGPVGQILDAFPKGFSTPTAVVAAQPFMTTPVAPSFPPSQMEIYVVFDTPGILSVYRTHRNGKTTSVEQLNAAAGLTLLANAGYTFDVPVDQGETINLQYSVNANLLKLSVHELPFET
jgi:hypothetical protein